MRHPFLHEGPSESGLAFQANESVLGLTTKPATADRRSFFLRIAAALFGAVAVLTGRRSTAQAPTTQALGEEGMATTYALGEEGVGRPTTRALGEEGGPRPPSGQMTTQALYEEGMSRPVTTQAVGEEGGRPATTYATGEEGGSWQHRRRMRRATTFAVGEEGGYYRFR